MADKPSCWRRKYNVHPIQRKYFFLSLVPLLLWGFFLVLLVFLSPHLTASGPAPDPTAGFTVGNINALREPSIWFALLISMAATGILSFYVTNRFAGPLYRIEQILNHVEGGNLPPSVRVRRDDDLQELVSLLDGSFKMIGSALLTINAHHALAVKGLTDLHMKVKGEFDGEIVRELEAIGQNLAEIQKVLAAFEIPALQGAPSQLGN